jgi:hypothetical protein
MMGHLEHQCGAQQTNSLSNWGEHKKAVNKIFTGKILEETHVDMMLPALTRRPET